MKFNRTELGTHALALVIALVLWFFVMYTQSPTGVVEMNTRRLPAVTLEVRNRPVGLTLARSPVATVVLTVRGPRHMLDALVPQAVVAYLDLSDLKEGTHQLGVRVVLPDDVDLVSLAPSRVEIALDEVISVNVPVMLSLVGSLPAGYFAPPGQITPATVVVTGGRNAVARLAPFVVNLDISGLTASVSASAELVPLDVASQRALDVSMSTAVVAYAQPIYPTKLVTLRLDARGQVPGDVKEVRLELVDTPSEALLAAPPVILHELTELVIPVDLSAIVESTTIEVTPAVPPGTYLVSPSMIRIRIIVMSH